LLKRDADHLAHRTGKGAHKISRQHPSFDDASTLAIMFPELRYQYVKQHWPRSRDLPHERPERGSLQKGMASWAIPQPYWSATMTEHDDKFAVELTVLESNDEVISDETLDGVAGGLNPQPLPPCKRVAPGTPL
jgi:hypothetical protein